MRKNMDRAALAPAIAVGVAIGTTIVCFLIGAGILALQYYLINRFDWPTWCWVCLVIQLIFFILGTLISWVKLFVKILKGPDAKK